MLEFSFKQFEKLFHTIKSKFENIIVFDFKNARKTFEDFEKHIIAELDHKNRSYKDELNKLEYSYKKFSQNKDSYFSFIHTVQMDYLNQIKNFKNRNGKGKLKRD